VFWFEIGTAKARTEREHELRSENQEV